jgi:hypothetical protein
LHVERAGECADRQGLDAFAPANERIGGGDLANCASLLVNATIANGPPLNSLHHCCELMFAPKARLIRKINAGKRQAWGGVNAIHGHRRCLSECTARDRRRRDAGGSDREVRRPAKISDV